HLLRTLEADDHHVDRSRGERKTQGLAGALDLVDLFRDVPLRQDLHTDNALAGAPHALKYGFDMIRSLRFRLALLAVHVLAPGVEAREVHLDPGVAAGRFE